MIITTTYIITSFGTMINGTQIIISDFTINFR